MPPGAVAVVVTTPRPVRDLPPTTAKVQTMPAESPLSTAHLRLDGVLARCPGSNADLRHALRSLDADHAATLCRLLESLLTQATRSGASGWTRGFAAGQQM